MTEIDNNMAGHGSVQVYFITDSPDIELPEEKRHLIIPTSVRRYGLSQILNSESMLNTPSPIPFDFIINGTFLQTSLDEYLTANGLSAENTLTLRYVRSLIPPLYEASFEHDDWVSSVDVFSVSSPAALWGKTDVAAGQERILSASYDGLLRVWNKSGQTIATSPSVSMGGHTSSIKSAKFVSATQIASAGLDRTIRLWKYLESDDHFSGELKPALELYGHKAGVDSIAVHAPSRRILSASSDGKIGIWSTSKADGPAAPATLLPNASSTSSKRRKLSTQTSTPQRGALSLIDVHHGPVSDVIFDPRDSTVGYSASLDHTIRTLDLVTASLVDTRTTGHPLLCIESLTGLGNSPLLAVGTTARHVTLVDPRVSSNTTSVMTLRGHTNKVVSLSPDPTNSYSLISGSHDGTCRVWDLRSTRSGTTDEGGGRVSEPVYLVDRDSLKDSAKRPVAGDGIKVFSVVWNKEVGIVSAGEDKMVQINRGRDLLSA